MNKKLIALAVAGVFAAPAVALAQTTIYGSFNAEYGVVSAPDRTPTAAKAAVVGTLGSPNTNGSAAVPANTATSLNDFDGFDSGASNIGFKGSEKLGGGMSAFYQCESDVRFLAGASTTSGTICGRNSAVGLKGAWGNFFVGTWDSPQKLTVGKTRMLADTGFLGVTHMTFDPFSNRNTYSINYHSQSMGGFQVLAQTTSANAANGTTGSGTKGRLTSLGGIYARGPLGLAVGYTAADDNRSSNGADGDKDTGLNVGGTYTFGPVKLGVTYYAFEFKDASAATKMEQENLNLALQYSLSGANSILVGYTTAGDTKTAGVSTDNGAEEVQVSFIHKLSKRTTTAVGYAQLKNDAAGNLYTVGNRTSGTGQVLGGKSSVMTVQLKHAF